MTAGKLGQYEEPSPCRLDFLFYVEPPLPLYKQKQGMPPRGGPDVAHWCKIRLIERNPGLLKRVHEVSSLLKGCPKDLLADLADWMRRQHYYGDFYSKPEDRPLQYSHQRFPVFTITWRMKDGSDLIDCYNIDAIIFWSVLSRYRATIFETIVPRNAQFAEYSMWL